MNEIKKEFSDDVALKIAMKLLKNFEGCELRAYPDPCSDLSKALSNNNLLQKYKQGKVEIPENFRKLSGAPWTIGHGDTENVKEGDVITQEEADKRLTIRVKRFMQELLTACPEVSKLSSNKLAALLSFVYNIGITQFRSSTCRKLIKAGDLQGAGEAMLLFNKAGGKVEYGLKVRRKIEKDLFLAIQ